MGKMGRELYRIREEIQDMKLARELGEIWQQIGKLKIKLKIGKACETCANKNAGECKAHKTKVWSMARCTTWELNKDPVILEGFEAHVDHKRMLADKDMMAKRYEQNVLKSDERVIGRICGTCEHRKKGRCQNAKSPRPRKPVWEYAVCREWKVNESKVVQGRWRKQLEGVGATAMGTGWTKTPSNAKQRKYRSPAQQRMDEETKEWMAEMDQAELQKGLEDGYDVGWKADRKHSPEELVVLVGLLRDEQKKEVEDKPEEFDKDMALKMLADAERILQNPDDDDEEARRVARKTASILAVWLNCEELKNKKDVIRVRKGEARKTLEELIDEHGDKEWPTKRMALTKKLRNKKDKNEERGEGDFRITGDAYHDDYLGRYGR
jgi:hypothetical protein